MKKLSTFNFQFLTNKGFTLIELLVVIALISILATSLMVLINPLEQISRGNDTANTSDARQLLDAVNRFYANQGYYPWQSSAADGTHLTQAPIEVGTSWVCSDAACPSPDNQVLKILASNTSGGPEINSSFINKVIGSNYNKLFIYNGSDSSNSNKSTYVCFKPKSKSFLEKAKIKWGAACGNVAGYTDLGAGTNTPYNWGALIGICNGSDLFATCLP